MVGRMCCNDPCPPALLPIAPPGITMPLLCMEPTGINVDPLPVILPVIGSPRRKAAAAENQRRAVEVPAKLPLPVDPPKLLMRW